ncbi:MAG: DUF192 domain-containing protein [Deltaproteobacteria bacterium]|nr:DUF192 domain-containing protein [Deltaproteobacteria bacterium]
MLSCRRVAFSLCLLGSLACSSRIDRAIARADELRGTQQYDAALQAYQQVLQRYHEPKVAEVLLRVADLYQYNLQDTAGARATYRRITEEWPWQPATVTAYLRLADLAETARDVSGTIEPLEAILRYFPAYPERDQLRHRIGAAYLRAKNYPQARIELTQLLGKEDLIPDVRVLVLFDLAEAFLMDAQPEAAIPYYRQLQDTFPEHPLAERARAQEVACYEDLGEMGMVRQLQGQSVVRHGKGLSVIQIHPESPHSVRVTVEIAATERERTRGLMHREHLPAGHGMWFVMPKPTTTPFWMKETPLSLDLIFIDAALRVVDVIHSATPRSETPLKPQVPYQYVLEVPAGFAAAHHVQRGSRIAGPKPLAP